MGRVLKYKLNVYSGDFKIFFGEIFFNNDIFGKEGN